MFSEDNKKKNDEKIFMLNFRLSFLAFKTV